MTSGDLLTPRMAKHECEMNATEDKPKRMVFQPIIEEGVFRFDCSERARGAAYPSHSFANVKDRERGVTICRSPEYIPFYMYSNGQQIVTVELPAGTSFYGTGEVSGPLERTGKRVYTWNTDAFGYGSGTTSLYQSHPWVLALLPSGDAYGILADTTYRCEVDLCEASMIRFVASAVYPVVTFGPFSSPSQILASLYHATAFKWDVNFQHLA